MVREFASGGKKTKILQMSVTEGRELRKKFQDRCHIIEETRRKKLEEKKLTLAKKEENLLQQREKQTNDIIYYGLWQSKERLETALEEITEEREKRIAIQAQLRFRQKMMKQKHEQKDIFRFSAKGKRHPISKLYENLS